MKNTRLTKVLALVLVFVMMMSSVASAAPVVISNVLEASFSVTDKATVTVTNNTDLSNALSNTDVKTIKLDGNFSGFRVDRDDVKIEGLANHVINVGPVGGEAAGIYVTATGIKIDKVTIEGGGLDKAPAHRGILTVGNAEVTVTGSTINNVTTGIALNPGSKLTATGNTFSNMFAGIGNTEDTILNAISHNTFINGTEGIGLGEGVVTNVSTDSELVDYLLSNDNQYINIENSVADYRTTLTVVNDDQLSSALANTIVKVIKLDGTFNAFRVDRKLTIKGLTGNVINVGAVGGEAAGIYVTAKGVIIEDVNIKGSGTNNTPAHRGIITVSNSEVTVMSSTIDNVTTGIALNPNSELTATGNSISNMIAGIGNTENTILNSITGNVFKNGTEGIGLGAGVTSSVCTPSELVNKLVLENTFSNMNDKVVDYRGIKVVLDWNLSSDLNNVDVAEGTIIEVIATSAIDFDNVKLCLVWTQGSDVVDSSKIALNDFTYSDGVWISNKSYNISSIEQEIVISVDFIIVGDYELKLYATNSVD